MKKRVDSASAWSWNDSSRFLKLVGRDEIFSRIESSFAHYVPAIESVRTDQALGRYSAEDVFSRIEIPSRTAAAMDGYAVRWSDLESASSVSPSSFVVRGDVYPDYSSRPLFLRPGDTYYVATGAPLPTGADTVVKVEEAAASERGTITVRRTIPKGKNVANAGEDIRKGQAVVKKGQVLDPADVAILIGVGRTQIKVYRIPKVGLLSVGNELKEFKVTEGERRLSAQGGKIANNWLNLMSGYVDQFGSKAVSLGVCPDESSRIRHAVLSGFRKRCDAIFTIGGSSVGRQDNVLDALEAIQGSETVFHGARIVPIRPSGVVMVRGRPVVMVPGHAVSAVLTFFMIALPILNVMSGLTPFSRRTIMIAEIRSDIINERSIDALFLVKLEVNETSDGGSGYAAVPLKWGSNLLSNLSVADGFISLAPHQMVARKQIVAVQLFNGNPVSKSSWSSPPS